MKSEFKISEISTETSGDYVSFVISDRDGSRAATIARTAIRVLAASTEYDETQVIRNNAGKIREVAAKWRKANPDALVVALGSYDC